MSENMVVCNLTLEDINKLADKVESGKLTKIKIKNGDCELVIEKEVKPSVPNVCVSSMPGVSVSEVSPEVSAAGTAVSVESASENISGNVVKAPIVGTFYSKPSPDRSPFVEVGKTVKKGDVLMIIESMKLMNEVQSDFDGVVKEILVKDGEAVEYDQPVMIIG